MREIGAVDTPRMLYVQACHGKVVSQAFGEERKRAGKEVRVDVERELSWVERCIMRRREKDRGGG